MLFCVGPARKMANYTLGTNLYDAELVAATSEGVEFRTRAGQTVSLPWSRTF